MAQAFSKEKIAKGEFAEIARMAYAANPQEFSNTFAKIGIIIKSPDDVEALIKGQALGYDFNGVFKNSMGLGVKFDARNVVHSIIIPVSDVQKNVVFAD